MQAGDSKSDSHWTHVRWRVRSFTAGACSIKFQADEKQNKNKDCDRRRLEPDGRGFCWPHHFSGVGVVLSTLTWPGFPLSGPVGGRHSPSQDARSRAQRQTIPSNPQIIFLLSEIVSQNLVAGLLSTSWPECGPALIGAMCWSFEIFWRAIFRVMTPVS